MRLILCCACVALTLMVTASPRAEPNPALLVQAALDHWRGTSSYSEMTMIIHRADWQREMSMRVWTEGESQSLVRITAPSRDAGTASLLIEGEMWTFAPKINRVIKVPSSMMHQSWMGSDFSNNDIAKGDDIVTQYRHTLLSQEQRDGATVYIIEAQPKEDAAVVWGREVLSIRDDYLVLGHDFYDQDNRLVKSLKTLSIARFDGRELAQRQRITRADQPEEWTEVVLHTAQFDRAIPRWLFTQSNLRNPRD